MTPEQLEAHRVRFEQQYADYKLWPVVVVYSRRSVYSDTYDHIELQAAWQAYQWALADTDRAQRAAPGVQGGEVRFGGRCEKHLSPKPCAACAQPPQQSAQPVAAANGWAKGLEIRMSQGWKLKGGICPVLYSDTVNGYGVGRDDLWLATTDALKSAQPVEVQRVPLTDATQFEKDVARWMEKDGLTREQAECEVNYRTTRKALKSGLSAHGIKPTSSEGGA